MKVNKLKVMSTIGALGLTASVLAGCGGEQQEKSDDDDFVKVVNSEGETMYIDEDEFEEANQGGGGGMGMFLLFSSWNGNNHSGLSSSKGFKGSTFKSKPSVSSGAKSGAKSGSGVGKSAGAKSGGFGG